MLTLFQRVILNKTYNFVSNIQNILPTIYSYLLNYARNYASIIDTCPAIYNYLWNKVDRIGKVFCKDIYTLAIYIYIHIYIYIYIKLCTLYTAGVENAWLLLLKRNYNQQ